MYIIKRQIRSTLDDANLGMSRVIGIVNRIITDENLQFDIRLVLNELVINSVIHGNNSDMGKQVNFQVKIKDDLVSIKVADEGRGICYRKDDYDRFSLKPNGRGLHIVEKLSNKVLIDNNVIEAVIIK